VALEADIIGLTPRDGNTHGAHQITRMLFEGLMRFGKGDCLEWGIAHHYTLSRDQKTYTFFLRPSRWSDGTALTAYDFEYAWKQFLSPETLTTSSRHFYPILNAKAVVSGEKSIDTVGIHALDEKTLRVDLEYPTAFFLELLASNNFFPVPHFLAKQDPKWMTNTPISNGPFKLKTWNRGRFIEVENRKLFSTMGIS